MYKLIKILRKAFKNILPTESADNIYEIQIRKEIARRIYNHPNTFCRYGAFGFSQCDEDGLTMEIIRRLGIQRGKFCEFGVGNGTENNTIILLSLGWSGVWYGGEDILIDTTKSNRLMFVKSWITKHNITQLFNSQNKNDIDLISLDLDGNDYYFIEELLSNDVRPKVFIAEYNSKFLPGIKFVMPYDANHSWAFDDYFGASLSSLENLFSNYDYSLICCNAGSGMNAFFVKNEYINKFPEIPGDIFNKYSPPLSLLRRLKMHTTSVVSQR